MMQMSLLLKRFATDERGAFALIFAVTTLIVLVCAGAAVDYTRFQRDRAEVQTVLDGLALALQPQIYAEDSDTIRAIATARLNAHFEGREMSVALSAIEVDTESGRLMLASQLETPMYFIRLIGIETLAANMKVQAEREPARVELALVLDNSGSMLAQNRIGELKRAARCAVNIIFHGNRVANACELYYDYEPMNDARISIIPFTSLVNVGAANANAAWIDRGQGAPTARDGFSDRNDPFSFSGAGLDRLALYAAMEVEWRGCVEARPHLTRTGMRPDRPEDALDTSDIAPDPANPLTLFVPALAPDSPDYIHSPSDNWGRAIPFGAGNTQGSLHAPGYYNYTEDSPQACQVSSFVNQQCRMTTQHNANGTLTRTFHHLRYDEPATNAGVRVGACDCPDGWAMMAGSTGTTTQSLCTNAIVHNLPHATNAERFEISRFYGQRLCKYMSPATHASDLVGPNADCPSSAILPLNASPQAVVTALDGMQIRHQTDGTNIHEGTAWGFRTLSPGDPFAGARDYDEAISKVMIVMTDGENWFVRGNSAPSELWYISQLNGAGRFSAYGYPFNNTQINQRMGQYEGQFNAGHPWAGNTPFISEMNRRTLATCANAKAEGIEIYTVGLLQDIPAARLDIAKTLLRNCATTASHAYFPSAPGDLVSVYREIAGRMGALRLTQ